jgi:hypothetical protein
MAANLSNKKEGKAVQIYYNFHITAGIIKDNKGLLYRD